MKIRIVGAALAAALLVTAPAVAREKQVSTPSGRAEMVFAYTSLADALTAVQSTCMDKGWMVVSNTNNQVICEVPMGIWQSAFTQAMIGNSYSTTPKQFARFSLAEVSGNTRVQVQGWVETQMAFGQMQQHQYTDDTSYDNYMGFLMSAGAQLPVGSSFNGKAYLGFDQDPTTWTNGKKQQYGERVKHIIDRAPGYRWGLREGDIITKVNGKTFKDGAGLHKLLDKQKVGQLMTLTVMRGGVEQTISGTAEGRPAVTMLVDPKKLPQVEGVTPVGAQMGIAVFGGYDPWLEYVAKTSGQPIQADAEPAVIQASNPAPAAAPVESEADKLRRELAEAKAKLQAIEAKQAAPAGQSTP